jgi:hypothetical protein
VINFLLVAEAKYRVQKIEVNTNCSGLRPINKKDTTRHRVEIRKMVNELETVKRLNRETACSMLFFLCETRFENYIPQE